MGPPRPRDPLQTDFDDAPVSAPVDPLDVAIYESAPLAARDPFRSGSPPTISTESVGEALAAMAFFPSDGDAAEVLVGDTPLVRPPPYVRDGRNRLGGFLAPAGTRNFRTRGPCSRCSAPWVDGLGPRAGSRACASCRAIYCAHCAYFATEPSAGSRIVCASAACAPRDPAGAAVRRHWHREDGDVVDAQGRDIVAFSLA